MKHCEEHYQQNTVLARTWKVLRTALDINEYIQHIFSTDNDTKVVVFIAQQKIHNLTQAHKSACICGAQQQQTY